ncbi:MAG: SpoIIE family protein phosphatase [Phycisphaerales bacterium JB038]
MSEPPLVTLRPIARSLSGERVGMFTLRLPGPYVIGRGADADWRIPDPLVSRRHARICCRDGQWHLSDLGSRHGTSVNGKRLGSQEEVPVAHGDRLAFGAWMCRCHSEVGRQVVTTALDDGAAERADISVVDASQFAGVAQRRLEALLSLSTELNLAGSEDEVASAVVQAVARATGCARVVVARQVSDAEIEVLASTAADPPRLSRSLIDAAARQGLIELHSMGRQTPQAHSILELNIRTAICAPIVAGQMPMAFLVLDTRGAESSLPSDAGAFCQSVAQLAGLTIERLHSADLAARHRQLEIDLGAARRAQELLSPKESGVFGGVSYAFKSIAGRVVAGDLFDIFPLNDSRTALFLGDVSGKGVGAAVLMAAAQSQLRTHLLAGRSLAAAVAALNDDLLRHSETGKFVTLLAGVIDGAAERLEVVDAGHGLCILSSGDGAPTRLEAPRGFPLGVVEDACYESYEVSFPRGSQIVVFSDGAVEQPDAAGVQFGFEAVLRAVARCASPRDVAASLIEDVQTHAGGALADDLTVAAAQLG